MAQHSQEKRSMSNSPYVIVGQQTSVSSTRRVGPVVISADALYCVLNQRKRTAIAGSMIGGAVGGAIQVALAAQDDDFYHPNVSWLRYLPAELRSRKQKGLLQSHTDETLVLTIERKSVINVRKHARFNNVFDVHFDNGMVIIAHGLFSANKVKNALRNFGWPVDWKGEKFNTPSGSATVAEALPK
jgi:hypothetical protein